jgi:hypothetical protein
MPENDKEKKMKIACRLGSPSSEGNSAAIDRPLGGRAGKKPHYQVVSSTAFCQLQAVNDRGNTEGAHQLMCPFFHFSWQGGQLSDHQQVKKR